MSKRSGRSIVALVLAALVSPAVAPLVVGVAEAQTTTAPAGAPSSSTATPSGAAVNGSTAPGATAPGTTQKPKKPPSSSGNISKRLVGGIVLVVLVIGAGVGYLIYRMRQKR